MRKIVAGLFVSLDGVAESPDQWQFDVFDDDMGMEMTRMLGEQDAVMLGRVTYQEWADYWPAYGDESYGGFINNTPKYVVSTTLDSVSWGDYKNITLINHNITDEINKLKQQPGKSIGVNGSPTLVRTLLQNGLLDELTMMIHPVVVNSGKRLFKEGDALKQLKLLETRTTASGVALLTYKLRTE